MPNDATFQWLLQESLHGLRRQLFQASSPSLAYPHVFDSRFTLLADDDGHSVVGTYWWLRFYETIRLECCTKFNTISPPPPK